MTAADACRAQNQRSERHTELCDAIRKQEHRLITAGIGTTDWLDALAEIVKIWTELESL